MRFLPLLVGFMLTAPIPLVAGVASASPYPWLDQPLTNTTFVVFDVETTGLATKQARILEIGAIKFRNGEILARRNWLIKPDVPIPVAVQEVHGITPDLVSNAPPFSSVFTEFSDFSSNTILLAHSARFDHGFVASEISRHKLPFPATPILDTIPLFKAWHPELKSYSLRNLTDSLSPAHESHMISDAGLPEGTLRTNRFHSALYDCEFLTQLLMNDLQRIPPEATLKTLTQLTGGVFFFEHHRRKKLPKDKPPCKP
jgi:DNA polymerase-3 subunit alpha (Gram-positive type)